MGFGGNKNTESVGGSSDVTLYGNESKEFFHSTRKKKMKVFKSSSFITVVVYSSRPFSSSRRSNAIIKT